MKLENEIDLSVARDAVFDFVADQRNIPKWNDHVVDVRQERGDGGSACPVRSARSWWVAPSCLP